MARRTRGHIYKRKGSKYFWVEYVVNGKRFRESLGVTTMDEAKRERDKKLKPFETTDTVAKAKAAVHKLRDAEDEDALAKDSVRVRITVAGAWEAFVANKERPHPSEVTLKDYSQRWKKFTDWWTANHEEERPNLEDVTKADASAFCLHLEAQKLSPNRYNAVINTSRMVIRFLLPDIPNPFESIKRKRLETRSHRELTDEELRLVIGSAEGEFRTLFVIGLYTLLRLGDCATLRWSSIADDLSVINHTPRKTKRRSAKRVTIEVPEPLRVVLAQTPKSKRRGHVLPKIAADYKKDRTKISRRVQKHFRSLEIPMQPEDIDELPETAHNTGVVGFHSLRHSGASIMARNGAGVPVLQEILGHTSAALQAVYVHTKAEDTARAFRSMPDFTIDMETERPVRKSAEDVVAEIRRRLDSDQEPSNLRNDIERILSEHE